MSAREIRLDSLRGRKILGSSGRSFGRLVEIEARIELRDGASEYVVDAYHVSHYGAFNWLAGSILVRQLVERLGGRVGYVCRRIPESQIDIETLRLRSE